MGILTHHPPTTSETLCCCCSRQQKAVSTVAQQNSNPYIFRPLPDHPGSWFSACNPILTQLDDLCQKNWPKFFVDPNFFDPNFCWPKKFPTQIFFYFSDPIVFDPNIFLTQIFVDPKRFPTKKILTKNFFWPKKNFNQIFFWHKIISYPTFFD